jgi:hypothetical protein
MILGAFQPATVWLANLRLSLRDERAGAGRSEKGADGRTFKGNIMADKKCIILVDQPPSGGYGGQVKRFFDN